MKEEKVRRQNEFYSKSVSDKEKIEFLRNKLAERERLFQTMVKEVLEKKSNCKTKEYNFVRSIDNVKTENSVLDKQITEISKKAVNEAENCYRLAELRTEDIVDKFRSQSMKAQEQLKKAKEEHNILQINTENNISELENKLQHQISV